MANEKRLIYVDDFIKEHCAGCKYFGVDGICTDKDPVCGSVMLITELPTVDAVEVVHGRWEDVALRFTEVKEKCSVCGKIVYAHGYNYCPNCGAKMDLKGE